MRRNKRKMLLTSTKYQGRRIREYKDTGYKMPDGRRILANVACRKCGGRGYTGKRPDGMPYACTDKHCHKHTKLPIRWIRL